LFGVSTHPFLTAFVGPLPIEGWTRGEAVKTLKQVLEDEPDWVGVLVPSTSVFRGELARGQEGARKFTIAICPLPCRLEHFLVEQDFLVAVDVVLSPPVD
jgi:hypothetical protein